MSLGVGVAGITSIGPRMQLVSEQTCLAHALCRRLITPRESLSWDLNAGTDMREYLNKGNTPANRFAAARAAKDECEKDERVQSASVDAQFSQSSLSLTILIDTASGPFKLVALIDALTVSILEAA